MRIKLKQIAGARSGDKGKHSNVGIYFWWFCIEIIKISFGIFKNFLSNSHKIILGLSTILVISSNKYSFKSINKPFFFDILFL